MTRSMEERSRSFLASIQVKLIVLTGIPPTTSTYKPNVIGILFKLVSDLSTNFFQW